MKSVNGANSDEVEEVFAQAILSIEKVGDELTILKSTSVEVAASSDEKREEFEADLMRLSKEMELELKNLIETQPALSMKLREKIMEVMNSVK